MNSMKNEAQSRYVTPEPGFCFSTFYEDSYIVYIFYIILENS